MNRLNYMLIIISMTTVVMSIHAQKIKGSPQVNVELENSSDPKKDSVETVQNHRSGMPTLETVLSENFNKGLISSADLLIQGRIPGVQISSNSGEPSVKTDILIRGVHSVYMPQNPLIILDGFILEGSSESPSGHLYDIGSSAAKNPLRFINPNDIEEISVVRDLASCAQYGSRGSNGIIFINTKSDALNEGAFNFSSSVSLSTPTKRYDLLNREEYLDAYNALNQGSNNDQGADTDWQDFVFNQTISHDQYLSFSKRINNSSIRASIGYGEQQGIVSHSSRTRLTSKVNFAHSLLERRLKLNSQVMMNKLNEETPPISGNAGSRGDLLGAAYAANPTWPVDSEFSATAGLRNPSNMLNNIKDETDSKRLLFMFSPVLSISKHLKAKANIGYDYSYSERMALFNRKAQNIDNGIFGNGRGYKSELEMTNLLIEYILNYTKSYNDLDIQLTSGYSQQYFNSANSRVEGWGFKSDDFGIMRADMNQTENTLEGIAGSYQQFGFSDKIMYEGNQSRGLVVNRLAPGYETDFYDFSSQTSVSSLVKEHAQLQYQINAAFFNASFLYKDRFSIKASTRLEKTDLYGSNDLLIYPAGVLGWSLHKESFIPNLFSLLQLNLGYGITGNMGSFQANNKKRIDQYYSIGIGYDGTVTSSGLHSIAGNPNLKIEKTSEINLGVNFGILDNAITGSANYFKRESKDIIIKYTDGFGQRFIGNRNDMYLVSSGFEFNINHHFSLDELTISYGLNVATCVNELKNYNGNTNSGAINGSGLSSAYVQGLVGNQPLNTFYLRDFLGYDTNGQPLVNDSHVLAGKTASPKQMLGFNIELNYKNIYFSASANGQFGNYVYNNTSHAFFTKGDIANGRNVTSGVLLIAEAPTAEAPPSTRFLEKGNFLRWQYATLGYSFQLKNTSRVKDLRFYLTGQNLFVFTKYSGLDPEVKNNLESFDYLNQLPVMGIDYVSYPRARVFTLGMNVNI